MPDKERIKRLASLLMERGGKEFVNQMRCGGKKYETGGPKSDGLIERAVRKYLFGKREDDDIRRSLYDNLYPYGYGETDMFESLARVKDAANGKRDPRWILFDGDNSIGSGGVDDGKYYGDRDDIFATYLGIPEEERHKDFRDKLAKVTRSDYRPTIGNENNEYYKIGLADEQKDWLIDSGVGIPIGKSAVSNPLDRYFGDHTVSHGIDERGEYVSYYDKWDINPLFGRHNVGKKKNINLGYRPTIRKTDLRNNGESFIEGLLNGDIKYYRGNEPMFIEIPNPFVSESGDAGDMSLGIGKPVNFYDRIYLDDYYGIDSKPKNPDEFYGGYLKPVTVRPRKDGGQMFPSGGRFIRTKLSQESPMMYEPMMPVYPDVSVPERYYPQPNLGDYEYPTSTGMVQNMPIQTGYVAPVPQTGVLQEEALPAPVVVPTLDPRKDAARRIMAVENSKANANGGWDAKTGRWYPHKSHEGGADTIAYGIKLSNGTPEAQLALKQGYLTDQQAEHFVDTLVNRYYDAAKKVYDKKYGEGEWDKLSDKSQSILVDYSYNPGLAKFPKLMEGFHSGNMDLIRQNYKRYVNGKELGRNILSSAPVAEESTSSQKIEVSSLP